MNIEEKRRIILERISIIDSHIEINQSNIDGGYQNKDGMPSFESIIQELSVDREALLRALDDLE